MSVREGAGRQPRALEVPKDLAATLAALCRGAGTRAEGVLDLDTLFAIEVALSYSFADDLLAAFAADVPLLRDTFQFGLSHVIGHCGRLRDARARGDLIGIACTDDVEYAIDKRSGGGEQTIVCCMRPGEPSILERLDLCTLLLRLGGDGDPGDGAFTAALHRKPAMANVPGQTVTHKVFGRGTAFSEKGDGPTRKVTCDFPGLGLKVIQARFLSFDEPGE